MQGTIVKLDRGYPLVETTDGRLVRCEHATALVKGVKMRAVIGDTVEVSLLDDHDKGIIESIGERHTAFVRKDPAERTAPQVLAANFDLVILAEPYSLVSLKRIERALVLAHETGAQVAIAVTKTDLADTDEDVVRMCDEISQLAGSQVEVFALSVSDPESIERVRALVPPGTVAILVGKSGVGKSSLVNMLVGEEVSQTAAVREKDGKGRHTTVSREMVDIPGGGRVVDMPGIRGLGLWDADEGMDAAFPDVAELALQCRFRDCKHIDEPGCAVLDAVEAGTLPAARLESFRSLSAEVAQMGKRREEARRLRGEKASDRKAQGGRARNRKPRKRS